MTFNQYDKPPKDYALPRGERRNRKVPRGVFLAYAAFGLVGAFWGWLFTYLHFA